MWSFRHRAFPRLARFVEVLLCAHHSAGVCAGRVAGASFLGLILVVPRPLFPPHHLLPGPDSTGVVVVRWTLAVEGSARSSFACYNLPALLCQSRLFVAHVKINAHVNKPFLRSPSLAYHLRLCAALRETNVCFG